MLEFGVVMFTLGLVIGVWLGSVVGLVMTAKTTTPKEIPMACASCGSREVGYVDEETVRCRSCGWRTDPYEAMKAAEAS